MHEVLAKVNLPQLQVTQLSVQSRAVSLAFTCTMNVTFGRQAGKNKSCFTITKLIPTRNKIKGDRE